MRAELDRAFRSLGRSTRPGSESISPYFLSYTVNDLSFAAIRAQYGALVDSSRGQMRTADVQVRVGDPALDNTHGEHRGSAVNSVQLPLDDNSEALARTLWMATNTGYGNALDSYLRVKSETAVHAAEEDTSADFSREPAQVHIGSRAPAVAIDRPAWEQRVRELSRVFRDYPEVYQNMVMLTVENQTEYFTSSEGSQIRTPHLQARLVAFAMTRADDGMDLFREQTFEAETVDGLPRQALLVGAMRDLAESLEALRKAPVTEPYDGPAILSGREA
jgi:TldD protein